MTSRLIEARGREAAAKPLLPAPPRHTENAVILSATEWSEESPANRAVIGNGAKRMNLPSNNLNQRSTLAKRSQFLTLFIFF